MTFAQSHPSRGGGTPGVYPRRTARRGRRHRDRAQNTYLAGSGWAALYQRRAWAGHFPDLPDWAGIALLVVLALVVAVLIWLAITTNWSRLLAVSPAPTALPVATLAPLPTVPPTPVAPVVIVHYYYQQPNGTWAEQPGPAAPVSAELPRASTDAGTAAPVAPAGEDLGGDVIVYKGGLPYRRHKSSFLGIEIYDDTPLYDQYVPQFDPQRDTMELDLPGFQIWRRGK